MKKKEKRLKKPGKTSAILMSILLIICVIVNLACYQYNNVISQFMSQFYDNENKEGIAETLEGARAVTIKEAEEGIVLLKNEEDILPLNGQKNINVFGATSYKPIYGGAGSGAADETKNITLQKGLENAGFTVNEELVNFYKDNYTARQGENVMDLRGGDYNIYECPAEDYSDELIDNATAFSDTAVVILGRIGGEGADLPYSMSEYIGGDEGKTYLELQDVELEMLNMVEENFENVIVLINSSHAMELGFLDDEKVDAALWIGGPGATGCDAVGEILAGEVNPSGRLADTYAYDVTSSPAYYASGDFSYSNISYEAAGFDGKIKEDNYSFVDYVEGIYVGYRYYETRYIDTETGKCDEQEYQNTIQYPFGYGLSYTDFEEKISDFEAEGKTISMDVTVKNIGDTAGKNVVEVYYTAPYTVGGIEKSHVVLAGFAKTEMLEPRESETVNVSFDYGDMASYDFQGIKAEGGAYVLEAGDYEIKLQSDAHTVIDSRTVIVERDYIYNDENDGPRNGDAVAATNQFDGISFSDEVKENIIWVSRSDWDGTMPKERINDREASDVVAEAVENTVIEDTEEQMNVEVSVTGKNNGLTLADVKGLDYDDEKWEDLLNQLSVEDMTKLTCLGGWQTVKIKSVGKPYCQEIDGPSGLNGLVDGKRSNQYASEVVLASTWNTNLAKEMGTVYGKEALANGVTGIYGPGVDVHRTPFSGRNFEYFSEDGTLAGKVCASEIQGLKSQGVYTYIKHFALNDQETNRTGVCVWANEQAIREIYLKGFELAVKEGETTALMSSYNRIGTTWTGANSALLQNVLRSEWGFCGTVITDGVMPGVCYQYMLPDIALRSGVDLMLDNKPDSYVTNVTLDSNYGLQCMRNSSHNILYTVANSAALEVNAEIPAYWIILLVLLDMLVVAGEVVYILNRRKKVHLFEKVNLGEVNKNI